MVENLIDLSYFAKAHHFYHVYRTSSSAVSEKPHHHDYYQICYVTRGEVLHQQGEHRIVLVRGDAFIIPPLFEHSIVSKDDRSTFVSLSFQEKLFYPGFSSSDAYRFLSALQLDSVGKTQLSVKLRIRLNEAQQVNMEALLGCLLREFDEERSRALTMAGSLIAAILILLSQSYFSDPEGERQLYDISKYHESVRACIEYIDTNYMRPLTLSELARRFALSRTTLVLLFPQIAGMPFKRYLNQRRIEKATSLLRLESLSFQEIAPLVGYEDFSTFYRNFVKLVGISPTQYRQKLSEPSESAP